MRLDKKVFFIMLLGFLLAVAVTATGFKTYHMKSSKEEVLTSATLFNRWSAVANGSALLLGRPEDADIELPENINKVKKYIIYDRDGRQFAPMSDFGRLVSQREAFQRVVEERRPVEVGLGGHDTALYMPISAQGDMGSDLLGVSYIELETESGGFFIFLVSLVLCPIFVGLYFWTSRKIKSISDKVGTELDGRREEMTVEMENILRKMIHLLAESALLLDGNLRLIEANGSAVQDLAGISATEKGHVADLIREHGLRNFILELFGQLCGSDKQIATGIFGGKTVILSDLGTSLSIRYILIIRSYL